MEILRYILVFLEVICSLLLLTVILLQQSKGQGLGLGFGQGVGENLFGAQTGNVLTRATVILAGIFLINTTILTLLYARKGPQSVIESFEPIPVTAPASSVLPGGAGLGGVPLTPIPAPAASQAADAPGVDVPPAVLPSE
jgi:preprotein translocase subunit SecG